MSPPPQSGTDNADLHDDRPPISDRLIAEAEQLHADVEACACAATMWSGPAARRRLRAAKNAESDLLRVLGFASYGELLTVVGRKSGRPAVEVVEPSTSERDAARTREIERALGAALAEIEVLRTKLGPGALVPSDATPEVSAAAVADVSKRLGAVLADVERAAAEIRELRTVVAEVHDLAVGTVAELVLAKLEILVAERRERAGSPSPPAP